MLVLLLPAVVAVDMHIALKIPKIMLKVDMEEELVVVME